MMNFSNNALVTLALVIVLALSGCSRVTVPPATKGKVLSSAGYSQDVKEPGKYWLSWFENMVILDTSTMVAKEQMTVKMRDNLDLTFDVRFRTRIAGTTKVINAMFNDIKHDNYHVSLTNVYSVYGRDIVRNVSRSVVGKYTAEEIPANFDRITAELHAGLTEKMKNSPLEVSNITLAEIKYPAVITQAIEAQHARRLAIETEQNQQAIEMVKRTNELELAKAEYDIRITRAKAIRDENELTAKGISPMLIQYRQLEVMEKLADSNNTVFFPYEMINNVGLHNRMAQK